MPGTDDQETGGAVDQGDKTGSGDGASLTKEQVQEIVAESMKDVPSKTDLNKSITGAVKRQLGEALVSEEFTNVLDKAFEKHAPKPPKDEKPDPTETEALKGSVDVLQNTVKTLTEKNEAQEKAAVESARVSHIGDALQALIKPELLSSFRELAKHGHAGVPTPKADESGAYVVETAEGAVPYGDAITSYLKANPHWKAKATGTGPGGRGSTGGDTPPAAVTVDVSQKGQAQMDASYASDSEGTEKAVSDHRDKLAEKLGIKTLPTG